MMPVVHYVATDGPLRTSFSVTWESQDQANRHADTLRRTAGVTCVWIGTKRHATTLDAVAESHAERVKEPCK